MAFSNMNMNHEKQKSYSILKEEHRIFLRSRNVRLICLLFLIVLAFAGSLVIGEYSLSFTKFFVALRNADFLQLDFQVLFYLRLPRTLVSLLSGFALGVSGYLIQLIYDNPLGDPYIMGLSSASNLGATVAVTQGFAIASNIMTGTILLSLLFCLLCIALVVGIYIFAGSKRNTMILIGVALMLLFQSISMAFQYFSSPEAIKAITYWSTGNMTKSDWKSFFVLLIAILLCLIILRIYRNGLRFILLGDETALSMGVNPKRIRVFVLLCVAVMVSVVVSFIGVIGFIGLMSPHLYRLLMTHDDGSKAIQSGLVGALLLLMSDIVSRVVLSPVIIPVGIITSIIGIPAFVYLLMRRKNDYGN